MKIFSNVESMKLAHLLEGQTVYTKGYKSEHDGGHGTYFISEAQATDGYIDHTLAGGTTAKLQHNGIVDVRQCGVVGDGVVDDTAAMQNAISKINKLKFIKDATYHLTGELEFKRGADINLNGGALAFHTVGEVNNVLLNDDCYLYNGSVKNLGSSFAGHGGYQCPVVVGDYLGLSNTGFTNIKIYNLEITTNRPDGNGIFVTSGSSNVEINNIVFPSSSVIGRGILVHWGAVDGAGVNGTLHPRDVCISNIKVGSFTRTEGETNIVFISAGINITVKNMYVEYVSGSCVYVYAGDFGFDYAPSIDKLFGSCGITLEGITCTAKFGVQVNMLDVSGGQTICKSKLSIKRLYFTSTDKTVYPSCMLRLSSVGDVVIQDSVCDTAYTGIFLGQDVSNLSVINNRILNSYKEAIYGGTSTGSNNILVSENKFTNSNTSLTGSLSDILVNYTDYYTISNNVFSSPNATYNVRASGGAAQPSNVKITNNVSKDVSATGVCFSIGDSATIMACTTFFGNSTESATATLVSGQYFIPELETNARSKVLRVCRGSFAPTNGTWEVGDIVYKTNVTSGGAIGYVCTTSGTPGVWKTFGVIS